MLLTQALGRYARVHVVSTSGRLAMAWLQALLYTRERRSNHTQSASVGLHEEP